LHLSCWVGFPGSPRAYHCECARRDSKQPLRETGGKGTIPDMSAIDELASTLSGMPPIPDLDRSVSALLGCEPGQLAGAGLLGHYSVVGYETAAVYLVTSRAFALFEANSRGVSYALTLPIERLRRVGLLEDQERTRLIIEMEADKTTTTTTMDENGRSEGVLTPAGYEILEQDPAGRLRLRTFARALNRALAGT